MGQRSAASGNYVFDAIQIGAYTVTVEMTGFKRLIARGQRPDGRSSADGQPSSLR
jgi:hypothetical protein